MSRMKRVALVVAALLVVSMIAAAVLWSMRSDDDRGALPDSVGGWVAEDSEAFLDASDRDQEQRDEALERTRAQYAYNSAQFSTAYDDAEVSTRRYWRADDLDGFLFVVEIAAESGPVVPISFGDPEVLGYAAAMDEVVERDGVQCLLHRVNDEDPERMAPDSVLCQRSDSSRTVRVHADQVAVEDVVSVTNELWDR